jgi:hypothetical protein
MFLDRFCFLSLLEFQKSLDWFMETKLLRNVLEAKRKTRNSCGFPAIKNERVGD